MKLRIGIFLILLFNTALLNAAQYVAGDLAPRGNPDGQLNAADLLVLTQLVNGVITATPTEQIVGDVGPLNSADGVLDVRDMLVLQRAVLGKMALPLLVTAPPVPLLNAPVSPTTLNPFQITGTSIPLANIDIYVNGLLQQQTMSDAGGVFTMDVFLYDGLNNIYATASDLDGVSPVSNTVQVQYNNTIDRNLGGAIPANTVVVWTPGIPAQPYTPATDITIPLSSKIIMMPGAKLHLGGGGNVLNIDGTLVLNEGTRIEMDGYLQATGSSSINVNGLLDIEGSVANRVKIGISDVNPGSNKLGYVVRVNDGGNVLVDFAEIGDGAYGLYFFAGSQGEVTNSVITNNDYGVYAVGNSSAIIKNPVVKLNNNQIFNNLTYNFFTSNYANAAQVRLNALDNWWGPTIGLNGLFDVNKVTNTLYDYSKNSSSPVIDITTLLDQSGTRLGFKVLHGLLPNVNTSLTGEWKVGKLTIQAGETLTLDNTAILDLNLNILTVNGTLIANAGSRIEGFSSGRIDVYGQLIAQGTVNQNVFFGANSLYPGTFTWGGINVKAGGNIVIDYADIRHANNAIIMVSGSGGSITNSTLMTNNTGIGLYANNGSLPDPRPTISGNSFSNETNMELSSLDNSQPLDIQNNWWGSNTISEIRASINTLGTADQVALVPLTNISSLSILNVSHTPQNPISPAAGEVVSVSFSLSIPADVSLIIKKASDSTPVRLITQSFGLAGAYNLSWDGKDDVGNFVEEQAYTYELAATAGLSRINYLPALKYVSLAATAGPANLRYSAERNVFLNQTVVISTLIGAAYDKNSRIDYCVVPGISSTLTSCDRPNAVYVAKNIPIVGNGIRLYWDGRDSTGNIAPNKFYTFYVAQPQQMLLNTIVIKNTAPFIRGEVAAPSPNIEVKSNPYLINHSFDEYTQIKFQVDQNSMVTAKLLPPGITNPDSAAAIPLINNQLLNAEVSPGVPEIHTLIWKGYDDSIAIPDTNSIQTDEEGVYTFMIQATGIVTGKSALYRGAISLYH